MSFNISKTKLKKFSLFFIGFKKIRYGYYNRVKNLLNILKNKEIKFYYNLHGKNYKNKNEFLNYDFDK